MTDHEQVCKHNVVTRATIAKLEIFRAGEPPRPMIDRSPPQNALNARRESLSPSNAAGDIVMTEKCLRRSKFLTICMLKKV